MLDYWVNFANTGNPNGGTLVNWPEFNATNDCYLEIKPTPNGSQCGVRTAQCNLMDNAFFYTPCTSSVDVLEPTNQHSFMVYPNPTKGILFIKPPSTENFRVSVYDFAGNKILSEENSYQLDLTAFPTGIYGVVVNQSDDISKTKIIKQ